MNEKSFRILQISTSDIAGGAEKIAWDLFTSYRNQGHQSWLTVGAKKSQDPNVLFIPNRLSKILQFIPPGIRKLPHTIYVGRKVDLLTDPNRICAYLKGHEDFDHPRSWNLLNLTPKRPDIIHCHNLHGCSAWDGCG
jgi:hypothetical protein